MENVLASLDTLESRADRRIDDRESVIYRRNLRGKRMNTQDLCKKFAVLVGLSILSAASAKEFDTNAKLEGRVTGNDTRTTRTTLENSFRNWRKPSHAFLRSIRKPESM